MAELKKEPERARDISQPMDRLVFDDKEYILKFDNNAFRLAEDVYELHYGRDCNFAEIISQLAKGKLGAIMAVMYGGMVSGGSEMAWKEFTEKFTLTALPGVKEMLIRNVSEAMPKADEAGGEGNPQ